MKLLRLTRLFIFCFFKSLLFCSVAKVDENKYFECMIPAGIDSNLLKRPCKVFFVKQHNRDKDRFRYLSLDEFPCFVKERDRFLEIMEKKRWYQSVKQPDYERMREYCKDIFFLFLFENNTKIVYLNEIIQSKAAFAVAHRLLLQKAELCQAEINGYNSK